MTGIDIPIDRLVKLFESKLWVDITNKEYNGRSQRNNVKGEIVAQKYIGNNEYQTIMFDDRLDALCFFDCENEESVIDGDIKEQDVRLIFAVNLKSLYPNIDDYRATPEVHRDVLRIINRYSLTYNVTGIDIGLAAYGNLSTNNLKRYDMHPFHTFAIKLKINYMYNYCN